MGFELVEKSCHLIFQPGDSQREPPAQIVSPVFVLN
jgi:hypothetical protein